MTVFGRPKRDELKQAKRNDEHVAPLRKDESTAEEGCWRMGVDMELAVEAELKAPGGDWWWNWGCRVSLMCTAKPLT